jgi:hypothetical protein
MKVTIFVDSGSMHSFIDTRIRNQLNMFFHPTFDFQVASLNSSKAMFALCLTF